MRKHFTCLLLCLATLALQGCAFVNASLTQPLQPLEEKVLEGEGRPKILLIEVSGFISEKEQEGGQLSREKPSLVAQVREALQKAEKDDELAGVVVRINSPGGTVTASDIIHHELTGFRQRKKVPVYACITGVGASGGYYVAAASDRIFAHPTAVTGSIGVLLMTFNVEGLLGKVGVTEQTIKSGAKKDLLSPFRPGTPEELRLVQEIIDQLHARFVTVVLERPGSRLTRPELEPLADGRIFTADQALAARLVDQVGYLDDALVDLKKAQGIERARVVTYLRPGSYRGSIYAGGAGESSPSISLLTVNADGLGLHAGPEFLYLWRP
jgi:protease-4